MAYFFFSGVKYRRGSGMVLAAAAAAAVVVGNADENCIIFEPPAEPNKKHVQRATP